MLKRGGGILMHISSLPSGYGIGDIGPSAHQFADMIRKAGQRYWQLLPLNPTDGVYGESPYSSPSAFACNPLLISPDLLRDAGWLTVEDLNGDKDFPGDHVDFSRVREYKDKIFHKAFLNFRQDKAAQSVFQEFCKNESFWLDDYASFMVFKGVHAGKRWNEWPQLIKTHKVSVIKEAGKKYAEEVAYQKFLQYVFAVQWDALKAHCQELDIALIGDMPIYVNEDSSDVWANPKFFKLDEALRPNCVAGVPPDYFSTTGQRWGNPVYRWDQLKKDDFAWWMDRLRRQFRLFHIVRIDHFRGFESYWEIPAREETAVNGVWADGPRDAFFEVLEREFSNVLIIGEDLGIITKEVTALMERFHIPGMKVLQFAFSGDQSTHPYLPKNYTENCVVYTGTHDNNTTRGWFCHDASDEDRRNLASYLNRTPNEETITWDLIGLAFESRAVLAIIPLQDILNMGKEARMNIPGTAQHNWRWRLSVHIPDDVIARMRQVSAQSSRL